MNQEQFVFTLKGRTSDAATQRMLSRLRHVPGREPSPKDVAASDWYNHLPPKEAETVEYIIREAAELAVFSFFSSLDMLGVAVPEEAGIIEVTFVSEGERVRLNDGEDLHDIYNWHLQNPAKSTAPNT